MWSRAQKVQIQSDISRAIFERDIVPAGKPVVLKGLIEHWDILKATGSSSENLAAYLRQVPTASDVEAWFGAPDIERRFGYKPDLSDFNFERRFLALGELLDYLLANQDKPDAWSAYAGGIPIPKVMPSLLSALPMPLLDAEREMLVSLWIGSSAVTAAHWDVPQNLACVVLGRRRFTLFPTEQVRNLYVGPFDPTPAGQPISLIDFSNPDFERFPRFKHAMAAAYVAELEPGDALYIPSMWWHHVESPDPIGAMINFWWRDGPEWLATPLFTLFHALLTMRDLPENERRAWQTMFEHYIFDVEKEGDPMAHMPPEKRGLFGTSTATLRQRIKSILAAALK